MMMSDHPIHVPTECRAASRIAASHVVLRCSKPAHHVGRRSSKCHALEVEQHELQLVDEPHVQHEILGPDVLLVVREEVAEREMVGQGVSWLSDVTSMNPEGVVASLTPASLGRPHTDVIQPNASSATLGDRRKRDDTEVGYFFQHAAHANRRGHTPDSAGASGTRVESPATESAGVPNAAVVRLESPPAESGSAVEYVMVAPAGSES